MAGKLGMVPEKIDPFQEAIKRVRESQERKSAPIYFAAQRKSKKHNGIDLFVPENLKVIAPADSVLIGVCRETDPKTGKTTAAGASIGNGLVYFIPAKKPYFLILAHLSPKTFKYSRESHIGREYQPQGDPVAYTGSSMAGPAPHIHVSAVTNFFFGGRRYSATEFMELHDSAKLPRFLSGKNFYAIVPSGRNPDLRKRGYLDPLELIDKGHLRFSTVPEPLRIAKKPGKVLRV